MPAQGGGRGPAWRADAARGQRWLLGNVVSAGPGKWRSRLASPGAGGGRGGSPSAKARSWQWHPRLRPHPGSAAPSGGGGRPTFLLRNSRTREAATSSTKRLSMPPALPTRPRRRCPGPGPLGPVWPRCRGDGVTGARRAPPLPRSPRAERAGIRGGACFKPASESGRQPRG